MPAHAQSTTAPKEETLEPVVVEAKRPKDPSPAASTLKDTDLRKQRTLVSDTTRLLEDVAGVSVNGAGGISGLPAIHGLSDDRVRVQVDGMDLMSACPNHMNSTLSYISPADVGTIRVFAGVTPVSVGGDSLGGTIQVESAKPEFADSEGQQLVRGQLGTFYRSNGRVRGSNVAASFATSSLSLSYRANATKADNYTAGRDFKEAEQGSETGRIIPADEVASTSFRPINQTIALAWKQDKHLVQMDLWDQRVTFEGYPNQRMDMTDNNNRSVNLRYRGVFDWGSLDAKLFSQRTRHEMDMGADRYFYGTGMPMLTKADTQGGTLKASWAMTDENLLHFGAEFQNYTLYDWWPPVGGAMGPNAFWNIDYGRRNRADAFVEWERFYAGGWTSLIGVRRTLVNSDAAPVQGYDNGLGMWGADAAAFNAKDHAHIDHNWDMTALARHEGDDANIWEMGYAHKTRSPSLYQRYPWSSQAMAALMNNFVGDGNGYIGNENLKPEEADTLSASFEQRDSEQDDWGIKASAYVTHIRNYIDARRCDFGQCSKLNTTTTNGFVLLQYANQTARLHGLDLSADTLLFAHASLGRLSATGKLAWVHGTNTTTGDGLYNTMPLNMRLSIKQQLHTWSQELELHLVESKRHVSAVRNEMPTAGYGLVNWRGSYEWHRTRLDLGVENLFNRLYYHPLGGAYVGQGPSMTSGGIPWGTKVPGMGRSFNLALNLQY